jgi:Surface lipoprotein
LIPAISFGLKKREKEDLGQTLGVMGVGEGCYLVLPVWGPILSEIPLDPSLQ